MNLGGCHRGVVGRGWPPRRRGPRAIYPLEPPYPRLSAPIRTLVGTGPMPAFGPAPHTVLVRESDLQGNLGPSFPQMFPQPLFSARQWSSGYVTCVGVTNDPGGSVASSLQNNTWRIGGDQSLDPGSQVDVTLRTSPCVRRPQVGKNNDPKVQHNKNGQSETKNSSIAALS